MYKTDDQQGPNYSTGTYIQYPVVVCKRKESEKEHMYAYD